MLISEPVEVPMRPQIWTGDAQAFVGPKLGRAIVGATVALVFFAIPMTGQPLTTATSDLGRSGVFANYVPWTNQRYATYEVGEVSQTSGTSFERTFNANRRPDTSSQVAWLHSQSGLTWDQLSKIAGVSRRAIHSWANGARLNSAHAERVAYLCSTISGLGAAHPDQCRFRLLSAEADQINLYDKLRGEVLKSETVERPVSVPEKLGINV